MAALRGSLNTTKNDDKKCAESRSRVTKEKGLLEQPVVFVVSRFFLFLSVNSLSCAFTHFVL